jgi:hypothetical protein
MHLPSLSQAREAAAAAQEEQGYRFFFFFFFLDLFFISASLAVEKELCSLSPSSEDAVFDKISCCGGDGICIERKEGEESNPDLVRYPSFQGPNEMSSEFAAKQGLSGA